MKKLLLLLAAVGMIFTACQSGGDVEEGNGGAPFVPEITISPKDLTFGCNGGEQAVDITANFEYEVAERASWLTVEQTDEGLLVVVDANKNTSERSAFISITNSQYDINKTVEVWQEGFVPKIELAQQSIEVEFEPAEYEVAVTSPYSWEATTKNDWIVVESETGIAGDEKLKFTTLRNEEEKERKGTITLKNTDYNLVAELYITQKAFVPAITIEPESLAFAVGGGTQEIAITANFEYEYSTNVDWLTIEKSEKGITVTVPNYVEVDERTAEITISNEKYGISKVVKVTQGAFVPEWSVSPESLNFTFEGGTQEIAITANFEYAYSENADWLTIKKSEKGISVTVPNYVEVDERTAEITISNEKYGISKVVKATQGAFVPAITIEPESLAFAVEGGTQEVAITANFEYEFSTNVDWLTIKKGEKGINISAIQNTKLEECTAEITISNKKYGISKTISVVQNGVSAEPENVIIYTSSNGKIVTPYESNVFGANIVSNIYSNVHGQGVIIFDAPVTSIGEDAFRNCSSLTSVTIPDGVTSIGYQAFRDCDSLKAFYGKFASADNRCLIIDGVLNSFASAGLTEYTIPNSVTSIGNYAFYECSSLTSVTIGNSVTSIGSSAFRYCSSLTSVTIGNSVTSIGSDAFYRCTSLKSVTIPDSVTSIGDDAFEDCTGELIINSKKLVETNYTYSNYPMYIGWLNDSKFTKLTIGNGVTSIGDYAFYECNSLTSVTIGNGVTSIGDDAFSDCTSLKSVTIPDSVTSIGDDAFYECNSLISVTIGNSVTSIGRSAFEYCTSLTSVTIPDSVTKIGEDAFSACTSSKSVYITDLSAWCKISFGDYDANPLSYRAELYLNGSVLTNITIPSDITEIKDYAFYGYSSLKSVTIPDSVTSIRKRAFFGCLRLESLYCTPATPPSVNQGMFSYISTSTGINIVKPIGCKIYVPRNSVEAYKAASGWSDYASDIVGYDF